MRHFVAYHNVEKMGRALTDGDPFSVLTSKPVDPLLHNYVWLVVGERGNPKRFSLGSVFVASETGASTVNGFKNYASGKGYAFEPAPPLNDLDWFKDLVQTTSHFSFGVTEVKDERIIDGLKGVARLAGHQID